MKIALIGNGNVGHHLAIQFNQVNHPIKQIVSSSVTESELVHYGSPKHVKIDDLDADIIDVVLLCVPDKHIIETSNSLPDCVKNNVIVAHTSGSLGIDVFDKTISHPAVFYPLQTFTKNINVNNEFPIFVNAKAKHSIDQLKELGRKITSLVHILTDEKKALLHIAAVMTNNFTNHLIHLSDQFLKEKDLNISYLHPLIKETVEKAFATSAYQAQTGPARRNDFNVINHHLSQLENNKMLKDVYILLTKSIQETYH